MTAVPEQIVSHLETNEMPLVYFDKVGLQVLRVSPETGTWVIRNKFKPGFELPKHMHTGCVHAFTISGHWQYKEHQIVYGPGAFIFEPAGSFHTLEVLADNTEETEIIFVIEGAYIDYDENGNVTGVVNGETALEGYYALCDAEGLPRPAGIIQ
jgi:quercetin dioxygenase-like cupin family protein